MASRRTRPGGGSGVPKFWAQPQVTADAVYYLTCDAGSYALTGDDTLAFGPGYELTGFAAPFKLTLTAEATAGGGADGFQSDAFQNDAFQSEGGAAGYVLTGADAALTTGAGGTTLSALNGTYTLTGSSAALLLWHVVGSSTYALSGASAALKLGLVAGSTTYTLTGSSAALLRGLAAGSTTYSLDGSAAALKLSHVVGAGAYVLSGSNAALLLGHVAGTGAYALTGASAPLKYTLVCGAGSYSLAGSDAALTVSGAGVTTLSAAAGSYALTGTAASEAFKLTAEGAVGAGGGGLLLLLGLGGGIDTGYAISGSSVDFTISGPVTLAAGSGVYNLTGGDAGLGEPLGYELTGSSATFRFGLTIGAGAYVLTGADVALRLGFVPVAGAYALNGSAAAFQVTGALVLLAEPGVYALNGSDATFTITGVAPPEVLPAAPPGGAGYRTGPYKRLKLRKKRKKEELQELLEFVRNLPPPSPPEVTAEAPPSTSISLLDGMAVPTVPRLAPVEDEDEDEIALLLEVL